MSCIPFAQFLLKILLLVVGLQSFDAIIWGKYKTPKSSFDRGLTLVQIWPRVSSVKIHVLSLNQSIVPYRSQYHRRRLLLRHHAVKMASTTSRPNILFIMADDHAAKSISAYGAGINHTPHLDRLATEGMLFNHCYVTNSICTPSRAAILTGTHNHVNDVMTLDSSINSRLPNVAKSMRTGGYATAMYGKWHLGEGKRHEPSGFDDWAVIPGQGEYWDPAFINKSGMRNYQGYATDIITDMSLDFIKKSRKEDPAQPFFVMCHHKAPHRSWECDDKHKDLYKDPIRLPDTFSDDYKNRARAAKIAKMRVADDLTYFDLGLVQPDGGSRQGLGDKMINTWYHTDRKIKVPEDITKLKLIDKEDGTVFTFKSHTDLVEFKFQRYMQRYLRTSK